MGAKYLPTVKDRKASQRFQEQQNARAKLKKQSGKQAEKPGKKK
jgi:hypothetical protein